MSCNNCTSYECISIGIAGCNKWVELPLIADGSGTWSIELQMAGGFLNRAFVAVEGEKIVLPTIIFNEHATHIARIFRIDGSQFLDTGTCYKIITHPVSNVTEPEPPPTPTPSDCVCVTPQMVVFWNDKKVPVLEDVPDNEIENVNFVFVLQGGNLKAYGWDGAVWQPVSGTEYTAGTAIDITGNVISVDPAKVLEWNNAGVVAGNALSDAAAAQATANSAASAAAAAQSTANAAIPLTQKGVSGGVATLDPVTAKVPASQLDLTAYAKKETAQGTGTAVQFTEDRIYGTFAAPITGNITDSMTGATNGVTLKIYHKGVSEPTWPAGWKRLNTSKQYAVGGVAVNMIFVQYDNSRVQYLITQEKP